MSKIPDVVYKKLYNLGFYDSEIDKIWKVVEDYFAAFFAHKKPRTSNKSQLTRIRRPSYDQFLAETEERWALQKDGSKHTIPITSLITDEVKRLKTEPSKSSEPEDSKEKPSAPRPRRDRKW